ncbi:MAG: hypothetical protein PUA86_04710, partial [Clostridiaceae bacterium]|nr:hypothetical protein [Clostridiaceae bacterium]
HRLFCRMLSPKKVTDSNTNRTILRQKTSFFGQILRQTGKSSELFGDIRQKKRGQNPFGFCPRPMQFEISRA